MYSYYEFVCSIFEYDGQLMRDTTVCLYMCVYVVFQEGPRWGAGSSAQEEI